MKFHIDKCYFDAVAPDGRCFIGYSAVLKWGWFRLRYHGGMWENGTGEVKSTDRYFSAPWPRADGVRVDWQTTRGMGTWKGRTSDAEVCLYHGQKGEVKWNLRQDRAAVSIPDGSFGAIDGIGYTERLRMTVAPWELPIKRLHWGRFHGERTTLVWIRWDGPHPLSLFVLDARTSDQGQVDEHGVRVEGNHLRFIEQRVLRDGTLGKTLFGRKRWLRFVFPWRGLNIVEKKFVTRCEFTHPDGTIEKGWAIHEMVNWP